MAEYIERGSAMRTAHILRPEDKELMSAISIIPAVSVPQWISVKDKLPEPGENPVLAGCEQNNLVFIAWYHEITECWRLPSGVYCEVTHWMPRPELPKGENDG